MWLGVAITQLFTVTVVCICTLKFYDHNLDATFIGVIATMVTGMAGFLTLHFNQNRIEKKVDDAKKVAEGNVQVVKETADKLADKVESVASDLQSANKEVLEDQTKTIVNEIKTSSS